MPRRVVAANKNLIEFPSMKRTTTSDLTGFLIMEYYKNLDLADIKYFCEIDNIKKVEQWINILDYEDIYKVSDLGRVKSLKREIKHSHSLKQNFKERIRSLSNKDGYLSVGLSKNGIVETFLVHQLVAISFVSNPNNLPEVNHKKGNKKDNRAISLEWSNRKENMQHAKDHNLIKKGERCTNTKLTEKDVLEIRASKLKQCEIAKKYGVGKTSIQKIISRTNWKHVLKKNHYL